MKDLIITRVCAGFKENVCAICFSIRSYYDLLKRNNNMLKKEHFKNVSKICLTPLVKRKQKELKRNLLYTYYNIGDVFLNLSKGLKKNFIEN